MHQYGTTKIYKAATNKTKGGNDKYTIIAEYLNIILTAINILSKQKISIGLKWHIRLNKYNQYLQNFSFQNTRNTFFSDTHGTFARIDHTL